MQYTILPQLLGGFVHTVVNFSRYITKTSLTPCALSIKINLHVYRPFLCPGVDAAHLYYLFSLNNFLQCIEKYDKREY